MSLSPVILVKEKHKFRLYQRYTPLLETFTRTEVNLLSKKARALLVLLAR